MPITIITPVNGVLSLGAQVNVNTTFPGPIPIDWEWWISVIDATTEAVQLQTRVVGGGVRDYVQVWGDPSIELISANSPTLRDGGPARLLVELRSSTGVVEESASTAITYEGVTGLPVIEQMRPQGQGGLTADQAVQLQTTAEASALSALTDALLLTEITNGPSSGPVVADLVDAIFGVIVRLTTLPEGLAPQTPDQQYWTKTLAVVRVFRGNDLWIRAPIHTPTKIVAFEKEGLVVWVPALTLTTWLLNMHLIVDFLPGVTGQVYRMHFP